MCVTSCGQHYHHIWRMYVCIFASYGAYYMWALWGLMTSTFYLDLKMAWHLSCGIYVPDVCLWVKGSCETHAMDVAFIAPCDRTIVTAVWVTVIYDHVDGFGYAGDGMSPVMFENILKELSNLINENDLHVSQVYTSCLYAQCLLFAPHMQHFWPIYAAQTCNIKSCMPVYQDT